MEVTRASPSAVASYNHCAFKFYMEDVLKIKTSGGSKTALQGTIIHQVFEWMSRLKLKNKTNVDPLWLLNRSWDLYTKANPTIDLKRFTSRGESADFKKCKTAVELIVNNKYYNPYNLKIIKTEDLFNIEMPGNEWLTYQNKPFLYRGRIDLIHEIDENTIEIVDWKSGKASDFYTFKPKDIYSLINDVQARMYHIAAINLFPKYKNIIITFYYILDGGPISFSLDIEDVQYTMQSLWNWFQKVKKDKLFLRNKSWKCKLCQFYKNGICDKIWSDLSIYGTEFIKTKYYQLNLENINV